MSLRGLRRILRTAALPFVGTVALTVGVGCSGPPTLAARPATPVPPAAAAASPFVHRDGFFPARDGTVLYEQSWHPRDGQDVRGVLVIVHGLKDHGTRYHELAGKLVTHGYAVYALDLRGHAHSAGMRVYVEQFADYVEDVDTFVKRAQASEPKKPLFLLGHSMGGAIATLYALEKKPALAGLTLSGAALKADVSGFKVFGTRLVASVSPRAGVFNLDLKDFSRDPTVVHDCETDPLVYQDGAPAHTAAELLTAIDHIQETMDGLTVPVLILHGSADRVTPPEGSRQLYGRAHAVDKTLKVYDGLVHDLLHEPEKAQVMEDVTQWMLARTPAAASPAAALAAPPLAVPPAK